MDKNNETRQPDDIRHLKYYYRAVEEQHGRLLSRMADAACLSRTAATQGLKLSEDGYAGLFRLAEIWSNVYDAPENIPTDNPVELLADLVAQLYSGVTRLHRRAPVWLAFYLEMNVMMDSLIEGEWFEE